jgi:ribonuclease Y
MVEPTQVDDDGAVLLSHELAREIEDQLEYPGQVKVTVIRESRAVDVAGNRPDPKREPAPSAALDA